jgi:hypothetical protein
VRWRWGRKGSAREVDIHTSDQVRALTEDLCGRDIYVDHVFGERL